MKVDFVEFTVLLKYMSDKSGNDKYCGLRGLLIGGICPACQTSGCVKYRKFNFIGMLA